jgi:hypothetical protein
LGPITLIESTTNRNDPGGAWQYTIHEDGTSQTIDWEQFQAQAPTKMDFNAERFSDGENGLIMEQVWPRFIIS